MYIVIKSTGDWAYHGSNSERIQFVTYQGSALSIRARPSPKCALGRES